MNSEEGKVGMTQQKRLWPLQGEGARPAVWLPTHLKKLFSSHFIVKSPEISCKSSQSYRPDPQEVTAHIYNTEQHTLYLSVYIVLYVHFH